MAHVVGIQPSLPTSRCVCGLDARNHHHSCDKAKHLHSANVAIRHSTTQSASTSVDEFNILKRPRLVGLHSKVSKRGLKASSPISPGRRGQLGVSPVNIFHPEPFNAYPIKNIGCVHQMAEYFVRVWAPRQGRGFAIDGHPRPYLSLLFPFALQHAVLFESVVALSRVFSLLTQDASVIDDRAFVYHHYNSKYALQRRLGSAVTCADDVTILTVACLSTIDYTLGEHGTAENYLRSMREMVRRRGGVRDDSPWEVFMTDIVSAFEKLWTFVLPKLSPPASPEALCPSTPPSSPLQNELPVYASHPFSPSFCESLSNLPQRLSELAVSGILSVQIVRLMEKLPRTDLVEGTGSPSRPASPQTQDVSIVITDLLRLATLQTTKMEHLLCHGLVAYCLPLQHHHSLPATTTSILASCVDAYMRHDPNGEQMDRKCLIWIAVVIASALRISADGALTANTVLDELLRRYPETRDARKLIPILRGFLWHDDLASGWKVTWEAAMERRRASSPSSTGSSPSISSTSARTMSLESILNQET